MNSIQGNNPDITNLSSFTEPNSYQPSLNTRNYRRDSLSKSPTRNTTSLEERLASEALAAFSVRNTSDAVRLLDEADPRDESADEGIASNINEDGKGGVWPASWHAKGKSTTDGRTPPPFFLLQEGIIDQATLCRLFRFYLGSAHPVMPLIPYKRLPIMPDQIESLAQHEQHLMSAILVVAAALANEYDLHDKLWARVRTLFSDLALQGEGAAVGAIEGLLLLSEYPPRQRHEAGFVPEDRMCWMTVGVVSAFDVGRVVFNLSLVCYRLCVWPICWV